MYEHLPLLELAELIADKADRTALHELHDQRKLFYYHSRQALRLAEFVDRLRLEDRSRLWCGGDPEIVEKAYDLTIGKFSNLPLRQSERSACSGKGEGPDCRYYFRAFLEHVSKKLDPKQMESELQRERFVAGLLQNLVMRHFYLSCLECWRSFQKLARRYVWKVDGYPLVVWLPLDIPSGSSRAWLEANVGEAHPQRTGERDRVQAAIDRITTRRKMLSLDTGNGVEAVAAPDRFTLSSEEDEVVTDLSQTVAEEKVRTIRCQRPAIQELGANKLRGLILRVFDDLAKGSYEPGRVADEVGLSRATMSRFAGSRWSGRLRGAVQGPLPDLWLNTAKMLAADERFMRFVRSAGLSGRIEQVLGTAYSGQRSAYE